ncbi:MAG: amidase family protein [Alphaproteobacteria bacterium]
MTSSDLISLSAREAVGLLRRGDVSPRDLVDAAADRIASVDPNVNAVPTLCLEMAREAADNITPPEQPGPGWLAGLPILVKDLSDVAGVRTTYGSPIFADHVPDRDDLMVARLKRNGAIVMGKTNTPEFGAGANTFNEVFGKTRNPWNTDMTCGGSSGGAAVALATGMTWLATGSDLGGSLRTPASFCSVVGMRPTPGRVATGPGSDPFQTLSVNGPMGRNVADMALMLDAEAGLDPYYPLSMPPPETSFESAALSPVLPGRIGFSPDLGIGPVDKEVADICRAATEKLASAGATVEESCPDFSGALDTFQVLRAALFVTGRATLLENHRDKLKPEMIWNIEKGMKLTAGEIGRAQNERARLSERAAKWFESHDVLACPVAIVPPFDVDIRYVESVGDHRFDNYVDWLYIVAAITLTGCPAISVPCGFTSTGLPVGLQLVAPPRSEAALLSMAAAAEEIFGLSGQLPIDPRPGAA